MGIRVECDRCRQTIPAGAPYVTVEIDRQIVTGAPSNKPESVACRTLSALKKAGITHIRELARLTEAQWLGIPGIGRGGADEILKALRLHERVDPKNLAPEGVTS